MRLDKDSGEGYDRANLQIAGVQLALLRELKAIGKPVIVVLIQGRPLILDEIAELADAVLLAWYPGMEGGHAIANALFGHVNPGGKLPISFPHSEGQLPIYYNTTKERSPYIDMTSHPKYPFGYGLSYTTFAYADLGVSRSEIIAGEDLEVTVTVTNTGNVPGDEVVQLYLTDNVASVVRPVRELKAFKRIHLAPGASQTSSFTLTPEDMAFYNHTMQFVVEPGVFTIQVGGDPAQLATVTFTVWGTTLVL